MGGKRILVALASICVIMVLWFLLFRPSWEMFRITEIVRRDPEGLTQMAEEILAQGSAEGYSHPGVRRISYWDYPGLTSAWISSVSASALSRPPPAKDFTILRKMFRSVIREAGSR